MDELNEEIITKEQMLCDSAHMQSLIKETGTGTVGDRVLGKEENGKLRFNRLELGFSSY